MGGYWPWIKNRKVRERETQRHRDQRFMGVIYYIGLNDRHSPSNLCSHQLNTQINLLFSPFFFFLRKLFSPIEHQIKNVVINISLFNINIIYFQFQHLFSYFQLVQITLTIMGIRKHFPVQQNKRFFQYFIYNYSYDHYYYLEEGNKSKIILYFLKKKIYIRYCRFKSYLV